jgi:DNA polymerase I-like protein with 3'-5' exonuclease and polymerase domains
MQLVTLDFETYYDVGFSLSGLTTEEYIRDARFQVIGVAIKINEGETYWVTGFHEVIQEALNKIDWHNSALLCHNTQFDGAILAFRFGIIPGLYLDTLSMARATNGVEVGGSLGYLVEHYDLGVKGTEVVQAKGKRLEDFSPTELSAYAGYCVNDVNLTYKLFGVLAPKFPQSEIDLIDLTLRMYTQPLLEVDDALLQDRLIEVQTEKSELLQGLMVKLECETEECVRGKLASNKQFAEILQELGVIVPTKISPATGKETYALAKGDQGFLDLLEHEDPFIQQLCTVRLGTKSTIEESRIERFIGIGSRNKGKLPIPLKYYGAHTGRWAGSDKVNFQNLPARDKKKKALKNAVIPPDGYKVINADSSQIEARVLVWLAGQNDVVQWYKEERDVYCEFASTVYDRPITKANKTERAVGKTCILGLGYGTGWAKLQQTLKLAAGVTLDEQECKRLVSVYRNVNSRVIDLWRECEEALRDIASWPEGKQPYAIGRHNALYATPEGIKLPNGLYIKYPGLTWDTSEAKSKYVYKSRRGFISIWGGSVVENVVQALARIIIGEQMLKINEKYRPVLTVHDAVVNVIPETEIDDAMTYIINTMSTPPIWATGLPVACEAHHGASYGEC